MQSRPKRLCHDCLMPPPFPILPGEQVIVPTLHPALDYRNINLLPRHLQKPAFRAIQDSEDATVEDLLGVPPSRRGTDWQSNHVPPASFLFVYFQILNKYRTPPTSVNNYERRISFAGGSLPVFHALEVMAEHSLIPDEVLPSLWPNIWYCMALQLPYLTELDILNLPASKVQLSLLRRLVIKGDNPLPTAAVIGSTPGLRAHLTRLWAYILRNKTGWSGSAGANISRLLPVFFDDPVHVDIIDAAGGTFLDLASLVIKHIHMMTAGVWASGAIKEYVYFVEFLSEDLAQLPQMLHALDSLDFLAALKKFMAAVWERTSPEAAYLTKRLSQRCLPLTYRYLAIFPGPREAIDGRLLVFMARCAIAGIGYDDHSLTNILRGILPGTLSFYSVLWRVEKALKQMEQLQLISRLFDPGPVVKIRPLWLAFQHLAEQRLAIKSRFDSSRPHEKFCDNIQCTNVSSEFRQCSRCRSVSYCSLVCQQADWTVGAHRTVCKRQRSKDLERPYLPARERAFLRYLVHQDYLNHKLEILRRCAEFIVDYGPEEPFYTQFKYWEGAVTVDVLPISELAVSEEDSVRVKHEIARLARSGGTMQLHVAVIANAGFGRYICCPLRTIGTKIQDNLARLANGVITEEVSADELQDGVKRLMEEDDIVECHQPIYSWIIPA
ncbi:hypothetical protein B0H16DRAFT_228343 [Mycena metata]|uniref:phytol kinase n=1 Tax=Mycena metata TaxID=1033252 RepID=A0AAD7HVJ5_9AGAR|nr:hypothetical protein B0H16DRAFT_228343 [Mycena metata]